MFKKSSEDRFEVIYEQGVLNRCKILVDKKTGVNYLFSNEGNGGGLTVLVDREGKPIVSNVETQY
ncbi:DUF6440 family protein [Clostridium malenominatum]|uniref:DUF6440 family protein n=1 Tax=Clostridium malenominatum TaxID=1539 RepID=A0ABN1IW33_9CLOT